MSNSIPLLLLLAACHPGLEYLAGYGGTGSPDTHSPSPWDSGTGGGGDTEPQDKDPLSITSVEPPYGPTSGGNTVVLTGGPFDGGSVSVSFGNRAALVLDAVRDQLRVQAPSQSEEGAVTITVETDTAYGSEDAAYVYFEDGTGEQGAYGLLAWYTYYGDYFSDYPDLQDYAYAYFTFIVPQPLDIATFFSPSLDSCSADYSPGGSVYVYDFDATAARLSSPAGSFRLEWSDEDLGFRDEAFPLSTYRSGATYDLDALEGGWMEGLQVSGLAAAPVALDIQSPDIAGRVVASLTPSDLNFQWNASSPGDLVSLEFLYLNSAGDAVEHTVSCAVRDDGRFSVPSSIWPSWAPNRTVWVYATRWKTGSGTLPYNGASSAVAGAHARISAFFTR